MMRRVKILSTGIRVPKNQVTSAELEQRLGLTPGLIEQRNGVRNRYHAQEETVCDLGAAALLAALEAGGIDPGDLDAVVSASTSVHQPVPCNAALFHGALELSSKVTAFDINSTCLSFITALDVVSYMIECGRFNKVAIVSSETASKALNWSDVETATLMGDGAAAVIIGRSSERSAILSSHFKTYSEGQELCKIEGGGSRLPVRDIQESNRLRFCFSMDGPKVFRLASKYFESFVSELLSPIKYGISDLDLVIPHQASLLAVMQIQKKLMIADGQMILTLPEYGNTVAASIPMAMHHAIEAGRLRRGAKCMMVGTSAGIAIGGMVIEY